MSDELKTVAESLGIVVRYDELRKEGHPRWTATIPGVARGEGVTPEEAGKALLKRLQRPIHVERLIAEGELCLHCHGKVGDALYRQA